MRGFNGENAINPGDSQSNQRGWRGRSGRGRGWRRNDQALQGQGNGPKPILTHFLSIPLGHLAAVRSAAESFGSAILGNTPPIVGLDPTIVVAPRRLHLTLGVMSLEEEASATEYFSRQEIQHTKTVSLASSSLRSLRPSILAALDGRPLRVPLSCIDIMKPERNDPTRAHVLYAGPSDEDLYSEDGQRLKRICELVNSEFIKAGLVVDDKRPLKLHCTLVNTSNRKPRGNGRRIPFSFDQIRDCPALRELNRTDGSISSQSTTENVTGHAVGAPSREQKITDADSRASSLHYAIPIDLGTHAVNEIQICRMGSWGPEGEYVCVGKVDL